MPYSNAQLSAYYTSLTGAAPTGADAILINAASVQSQNGSQSDVNTLLTVFNSAGVQGSFEVAESTYQFFTGSGVSQAGLNFLEGNAGGGNANGLNSSYFSQFNTENRYYNFAINLASTGGAGNASFVSTYGNLTFAQTVAGAYETIVGSSNVGTANANAAIADITSRQSFFVNVANQRAGGVDAGGSAGQNIALKAIVIGYILEEANKADVGTYAKAIDQLEASVAAGNAQFGTNILTTYGSNGTGFNTGFNALTGTNTSQQNIALTTSIDTFQPTTGSIQFVGTVNSVANQNTQFNPSTLNAGDQIRGTGSNNTLSITTVGGVTDATGGALISGIQTINVRSVADPQNANGNTAAAATLDANLVTGSTQINQFAGTGGLTINNLGTSDAVGIIANGGQSGGTLTANFVSGGTAVVNLAGGTTATAANAATGAAATGSSVVLTSAGGSIGTVQVNSNGGLNFLNNLTLPTSATELDLASTSPLNIGTTTAGGLKILKAAGSGGNINLGTTTDIGGGAANTGTITTVDTTGLTATGGLTARFFTSSGVNQTVYALGAGSDRLVLDGNLNGTTAVNLGEGANTLTLNGSLTSNNGQANNTGANSGANANNPSISGGSSADVITITGNLGVGTSIVSGGGGDTVNILGTVSQGANTATATQTVINGGGNATLVTNGADLLAIDGFSQRARSAISGFSTVGVYDALTGGTYDANAIGATNFATVGAAAGAAATVAVNTGAVVTFAGNLGAGAPVGSQTAAGNPVVAGGTLATNTGTVTIAEASAFQGNTNNTLTVGYANQTPAGTTGANATANVTSNLNTGGVQTLTFTGSEATRGNGTSAAAANGTTGVSVTLNLTDNDATSISFGGNDAFIFRAASTVGQGNNASTGFSSLTTINGTASSGNLSIDVSGLNTSTLNQPVTVTTGSGNDFVTVRDFARVTTGAATVATATTNAGFNTINVGVTTSGQTYSTVLDAKATDHISFTTNAGGAVNTTKIALNSTAVFQDYLDAATGTANNTNGAVTAFDFGGNTYIVENNSAAITFQNGVDSVIQLVGIHTITNPTTAGAGVVVLGS